MQLLTIYYKSVQRVARFLMFYVPFNGAFRMHIWSTQKIEGVKPSKFGVIL